MVLEKTLESPWDCKEIQPVHSKGAQSWVFIGRTDVEAETPIFWSPDGKNRLIWKDPDTGQDWRQEDKGMTEDEMVEWHHWLDEHEFEQTSGVDDGQGSLACCNPWGHKESDTTEWLNRTELNWTEAGITSHTRLHFGRMGARRSYEIDQPHGTSVFSTQNKNKATNCLVFILKQ